MGEKCGLFSFFKYLLQERKEWGTEVHQKAAMSFLLNITEKYEGRRYMSNLLVKKKNKIKIGLGVILVFCFISLHLQDDFFASP